MNDKKASLLITVLWIMAILSLLVISVTRQVNFALDVSNYRVGKLKSIYAAKSGVNKAIREIKNDANDYDSFNPSQKSSGFIQRTGWNYAFSAQEEALGFSPRGFTDIWANNVTEENSDYNITFFITDEESKININTAGQYVLEALLEKNGIDAAPDKANNILIWRGDIPEPQGQYSQAGYPCKSAKFTNTEELALVKGITLEDYHKIRGFITVFGDGLVNINTVVDGVINILLYGTAKELSLPQSTADSLANKLIEYRKNSGDFSAKEEIDNFAVTGSEERNLFSNFMQKITVKSVNFMIESRANYGKSKSVITAVFNRKENRIFYWHES